MLVETVYRVSRRVCIFDVDSDLDLMSSDVYVRGLFLGVEFPRSKVRKRRISSFDRGKSFLLLVLFPEGIITSYNNARIIEDECQAIRLISTWTANTLSLRFI